ncbi:MAG: hypothetical protein Q4C98_00030 [Capnocytophaga sp.]|nr:hypothetical protein [Capnocytophaga sp.]
MKILFFFTAHPRLDMIFKIQTEILMNHVLNKDDIYIVTDFKNNIVKSQINYNTIKSNLYYYESMFHNMLTFLRSKGGNVTLLGYKSVTDFSPQNFENISDVKKYYYKDYNLGMCAASSSISFFREHILDVKKYSKHINRELKNAIDVFTTISHYHNSLQPDKVYVFNGRMATYAPVVLYCKKNNVAFNVFEFSLSFERYHLLQNEIPHNIKYRRQEMVDLWENNDISIEEKQKVSNRFFERQRNGISTIDASYVGLQNKELNNEKFQNKEVIVFFNSSIDEFAAVPGWENYVYVFEDETQAISEICEHFKNDSDKVFILRIHPNLKFLNNTQNKKLKELERFENLIIIEPHSPIRSYSLVDRADKVITFGSTIGVEACYYGKPVICLGQSFYEHLDVAYIPTTKEELFSYINTKLPPKPKENSLPYGYWFNSFGEPFINFANGNVTEKAFQLTKKQKRMGIFKKTVDLGFYKKIYKAFNPEKNTLKRIKDPAYRKSLLREFMPWKVK